MNVVRRIFFWLHLSVGIVAGVVIGLMAATGFLLAYERPIKTQFGQPHLPELAQSVTPPGVDAILAGLRRSAQGQPTQLLVHRDARQPMEARWGRESTLLIDGRTGQSVGRPSVRMQRFFSFVESLHRSIGFGMQNAFGRGVAGAATLCFLFILLSGLLLWIPRSPGWPAFRVRLLLRRGLKARAREWNHHHVVGVWLLLPLLVIVLSGLVMAYPWANNLLYTMTGSRLQPDAHHEEHHEEHGAGRHNPMQPEQPGPALEPVLLGAEASVPEWQTLTVNVPSAKSKTVTVAADTSQGGRPEKVTNLTFDAQTGQLVGVQRFSDNVAGRRLRAWARTLHTGEEFGLIGRTVAALAALGGFYLVWTGLALSWRRFFGAGRTV